MLKICQSIANYRDRAILTIFICWLAASCSSSIDNKNQRVKELDSVLPLLARYRVEDYRHQDWCKNIAYQQGKYSSNNRVSTCNLFEGKARDFNERSTSDFQAIETGLKQVGMVIRFLSVKYDRRDRIEYAEFEVDCGSFCRNRFVYSAGYGNLPENAGNEMQYSRINNDWYFVVEDWN